MNKLVLAATTALVAIGIGASANAANLINNGSFESFTTAADGSMTPLGYTVSTTPVGSGQVVSPPVVQTYGTSGNYPTGPHGPAVPTDTFGPSALNSDTAATHYLYLSSDSSIETVGQGVTLAANTTYAFGFDYFLPAAGSTNPNDATLTGQFAIGDMVAFATTPILASTLSTGTWYQTVGYATTGASVSGNVRLSFSSSGFPAKDFAVDRVFLTAVPEPASWAMMVGGFGLMGAALRRKKAAALFA